MQRPTTTVPTRPGADDRGDRHLVVTALVAVQVFFGFHYIGAKIVLQYLPPLGWASIRAISAAAILVPLTLMAGRRWPRSLRDHGWLALYALFGVAINQSFFVLGLSRTVPSHSALINTMIPVATLLIAILMGRERPTAGRVGGIAISLAGVLYLMAHSGLDLAGGILEGNLLTLVNALSFSFFLVISKPILKRYTADVVTALLLLYGSIIIASVGIWQLDTDTLAAMPPRAWGWGIFVILFPTVGAYLLNSYALKRVDSSVVALFIYIQPLLAAALAVVLLGERITWGLLAAAALIFTGVFLAVNGRSSRSVAVETGQP
jgi:drug/metabolite transporter (DMT)-like permease